MDLGMRSTSHYDSMPCMTVASLEMSDEPFFSPKKAFTPSHVECFLLIFMGFECEGLDFQPFTADSSFPVAFLLVFILFQV